MSEPLNQQHSPSERPRYLVCERGSYPELETVQNWVHQLGSRGSQTLASVVGPYPAFRSEIYRMVEQSGTFEIVLDKSDFCYDWISSPIIENMIQRVAIQRILRGLIESEDFLIDDEVVRVVDKGLYKVHEAFKCLWSARFLHREGNQGRVDDFIRVLTAWSSGYQVQSPQDAAILELHGISGRIESTPERYDMMFMWLTLARANHQFDRIILPLDAVHKAPTKAQELEALLDAADRWSLLGCPLGIMLGFSGTLEEFPGNLRTRLHKALI